LAYYAAQAGVAVLREDPLVSIVTPSYNQGRYIEATIQSVLNQDYPNLEYLVVDGGSTDDTLEILKRYEGRLLWISEKDRGQADAINKGFRLAKGEILGWLNSDDVYLPGAIRKVIQYFQTYRDVGMLYGEGYHIDAEGKVIERYYTEAFNFQRLGEICFICQPTAFLRAEVFRAVGPLEIGLRYCLDYEYWMRIAKRFRIGYLDDYLANSRLHIETKTLSQRVEFHQEILQTVKRHYGPVPARWIYAYAYGYLTEHLMPYIQGIHADSWASQRASVFLRGDWGRYRYLFLEGRSSMYACPMSLRIAVGDQVLHEAIIDEAAFCIKKPLWRNSGPSHESGIVELNIDADSAFAPQAFGINDDTRTLSYRVRKLSLVDGQGGELVLYSDRKAWLFRLALPVLVLWKSLCINHSIPYAELGRDIRQLRSALRRSFAGQ
jgi:glycosyltransferase involved in cell wall biosynthesis